MFNYKTKFVEFFKKLRSIINPPSHITFTKIVNGVEVAFTEEEKKELYDSMDNTWKQFDRTFNEMDKTIAQMNKDLERMFAIPKEYLHKEYKNDGKDKKNSDTKPN